MANMTNAKLELLEMLTDRARMKCAAIEFGDDYYGVEQRKINLKVNYTQEDFDVFMNELAFEYNSGYGGQKLFGIVWLEDGTWFDRGEYDGSEWWRHQVMPTIPQFLMV